MVIENDPSAKMQVRSLGELVSPGTCIICGSGNCDEGYLDLGVFLDYVGTMYMCHYCTKQAGETIGLFTPEEVSSIQKLADELAEANVELKEKLDDALRAVDSISHLLSFKLPVDHSFAKNAPEESNSKSGSDAVVTTGSKVREPKFT